MRVVPLIAAIALSAGCGPTRAGALLVEAGAEVSAARTAQAEDKAPYEFTAAEAYLHQARHDHSYANFETAERFARKSRDCARLARLRAEAQTRSDLGASEVEVPVGLRCRAGLAGGSAPAEPLPPLPKADPDEPDDPAPRPTPEPGDDPLPPGDGE